MTSTPVAGHVGWAALHEMLVMSSIAIGCVVARPPSVTIAVAITPFATTPEPYVTVDAWAVTCHALSGTVPVTTRRPTEPVSSNAVNGAAPPIETCTVPTLLPLGSITIVTGIVVTAAGASIEGGSVAVSGTTLGASGVRL